MWRLWSRVNDIMGKRARTDAAKAEKANTILDKATFAHENPSIWTNGSVDKPTQPVRSFNFTAVGGYFLPGNCNHHRRKIGRGENPVRQPSQPSSRPFALTPGKIASNAGMAMGLYGHFSHCNKISWHYGGNILLLKWGIVGYHLYAGPNKWRMEW